MGERETPGGNFELVKNIKTNSNLETWQIKATFLKIDSRDIAAQPCKFK